MKTEAVRDQYVKTVCAIGQGPSCCRYLMLGAVGWECAKGSQLADHLDARVASKTINARGDNCPGDFGQKQAA